MILCVGREVVRDFLRQPLGSLPTHANPKLPKKVPAKVTGLHKKSVESGEAGGWRKRWAWK